MPEERLIATYLNDHLAGATAGRELAKRAFGENRSGDFGAVLADIVVEIEEDRRTLLDVMERLEVRPDPLKQALALAAERLGRLKLNGRLLGYSPLSRLVELEGLMLGVEGKRGLWRALGDLRDPRLEGVDFEHLAERAQRQHDELDRLRREAARIALDGSTVRPEE